MKIQSEWKKEKPRMTSFFSSLHSLWCRTDLNYCIACMLSIIPVRSMSDRVSYFCEWEKDSFVLRPLLFRSSKSFWLTFDTAEHRKEDRLFKARLRKSGYSFNPFFQKLDSRTNWLRSLTLRGMRETYDLIYFQAYLQVEPAVASNLPTPILRYCLSLS